MGGGGSEQTVGYRYSFGIHMGVCRGPVDEMVEIRVGDRTAWVGSASENGQEAIDAYDLFGGESGEGGVRGTLDIMMGGPTQEASTGLATMLGGVVPGFRKVFTLFYNGIVCMVNPYPKPWKMRVRRIFEGWDGPVFAPEYAEITLNAAQGEGSPLGGALRFPRTHLWYSDVDFLQPGTYDIESKLRLFEGTSALTIVFYQTHQWSVSLYDWRYIEIHVNGDLFVSIPVGEGRFKYNTWYQLDTRVVVGDADGEGKRWISFKITLAGVVIFEGTYGEPAWMGSGFTLNNDGGFNCWWDEVKITKLTGPDTGVKLYLRGNGEHGSSTVIDESGSNRVPAVNTGVTVDTRVPYRSGIAQGYPLADPTIRAMNPAHIIFECLTNREWGRGLDRAALDTASFLSAAQTLYNEGFGLCLKWTRSDTIQAFIQQILNVIGGSVYQDRATGLLVLKLIRADYVFDDLPLFDSNSGLLSIDEATVAAPTDGVNEVIVTYRDPVTDTQMQARAHNIAVLQASGGVPNSSSVEYKGVPTPDLALRLAKRDLRTTSVALRRFTISIDRRGWNLYPGGVIRIKDLSRNIPDMAVRIGTYEDGGMTDGRIKLVVIQDVFAMPASGFTQSQQNTWTPPNKQPCVGRSDVIEVPYFYLAKHYTAADFGAITPEASRFGVLLETGQPLNNSYDIAVKPSAPTSDENPPDTGYYCGYTP